MPVGSPDVITNESTISVPVEEFQPSAHGEDPILINHQDNPSFEELVAYDLPENWNSWGNGYTSRNATYQDFVYAGSQAGQMLSQGTYQWSASCTWYRGFTAGQVPVSGDLSFSFYYYIESIPSTITSSGNMYIRVSTYSSQYAYLNYYLSHQNGFLPSNTTNQAYFLLNSTTDAWHSFDRNVTADYVAAFGSPPPAQYVNYMQFHLNSPRYSSVISEAIIDDVSLLDNTSTERITNGDFEDTNDQDWWSLVQSPSSILPSSDSTEGLQSCNLSITAAGVDSSGEAGLGNWFGSPQGFYADEPGTMILEFDWKYYDTWNGGDQWSYVYLFVQNATDNHIIVIILGADMDSPFVSNYSYATYVLADNFGNRGTWQHFNLDVYDILNELKFTDMTIGEVTFQVQVGNYANSTCTLLVDNYKWMSYPARDAGFEQDHYYPSTPLTGWYTYGSGMPFLDQTTDSHTGNFAANITLYGGSTRTSGVSSVTSLDVESGLFTDFWWRLDQFSGTGSYVTAVLELDYGAKYIHYILAGPVTPVFTNGSSDGFINVNNYTKTGEWFNLVRDISGDFEALFGDSDYTITSIQLYGHIQAGESLSVVLDDIHFVRDTHAPLLTQHSVSPAVPMYYESRWVRVEGTDLTGVAGTLHYYDGASWNILPLQDFGDHFEVYIPAHAYGTNISYYLNLTDPSGNWAIYDNSGFYYVYTVGDDIDPTVTITSPFDEDVIEGLIDITLDANDIDIDASGIHYVELWVDGIHVGTDSTTPYSFQGDTRTSDNGTYVIEVRAYDAAGNWASDSITVYIENDKQSPVHSIIELNPSEPWRGEDVDVSLAVTDQTGVDNVTLYYSTSSTGPWTELSMLSSGSLYSATIPAQYSGDTVYYYIFSYDIFGQMTMSGNATSPLSFAILDDTSIPEFSELQVDPESPTIFDSIVISVAVTHSLGIDNVSIYYIIDDGDLIGIEMTPSGALYTATIPATMEYVEIEYYIAALSTNGRVAFLPEDPEWYTISITGETDPPAISTPLLIPETPQYGQTVTITATVTEETGLVGVLLHYKIGDAGWAIAAMTADGSLYSADIPAADWGTEVLYYVDAMDVLDYYASQGSELDPLSYTVGDSVLPTVSVSGPADGSDVTRNVTFFITGWDEGSGVDYAEMIINGSVVWSGSTLPSSILWITTEMPNDAYSITFRLYDNAGNHAFTELEYDVANPVGFEAIGSALSNFIQAYGFFLGAATVIILLVVIRVAARRRGGGIE